jgi:hypothetical protein
MAHVIPDIQLTGIDLDSIDDAEENAESVIFDVTLSGHPTTAWVEEFEYLYASQSFTIKPPVEIADDRLRIHYLPRYQDDLPGYVEFLSGIAHLATAEARRTEDIKTRADQEQRKREFRDVLSRVKVPA